MGKKKFPCISQSECFFLSEKEWHLVICSCAFHALSSDACESANLTKTDSDNTVYLEHI